MKPHEPRPHWFVLYLLLPLMILLFWLQSRLAVPGNDHELLQLGILFLIYLLVSRWIKANETALVRQQLRENSSQTQADQPIGTQASRQLDNHAWTAKSGSDFRSR
jgi:hypothetical protein